MNTVVKKELPKAMPLHKFLDPKNDLSFKRIFGTERNKDILMSFLNSVLERGDNPIKEVEFIKPSQDPEIAALRVSIVDIMCRDAENNKFIIEMQLAHEKGFDKRALYYAAKAYTSQRKTNISYKDLKKVFFLAITDFLTFPDETDWFSHIRFKNNKTNQPALDSIQLFFLQLPLFKKRDAELPNLTLREKWAYFFKYGEEVREQDLEKLIGQDQILKKAFHELDRFGWQPEEIRAYESIEMKQASDRAVIEQALDKGREEGREEGEKNKAREIALNLLKQHIPIDVIIAATDLTEPEIKKLKKTLLH